MISSTVGDWLEVPCSRRFFWSLAFFCPSSSLKFIHVPFKLMPMTSFWKMDLWTVPRFSILGCNCSYRDSPFRCLRGSSLVYMLRNAVFLNPSFRFSKLHDHAVSMMRLKRITKMVIISSTFLEYLQLDGSWKNCL